MYKRQAQEKTVLLELEKEENKMKLSEHLSVKEVSKSNTAARRGIDNTPTVTHLEALKEVAENIFEPLRLHFGVPIGVSSGYRGKELNEAIGGSKR